MAVLKIFVKQPGMEPVPMDAEPTATVASLKEQLGLTKVSVWFGQTYLKDSCFTGVWRGGWCHH